MLRPADLVRVGELIKLAAQTASAFGDATADDETFRIAEIAQRIETAADELIQIGLDLERDAP